MFEGPLSSEGDLGWHAIQLDGAGPLYAPRLSSQFGSSCSAGVGSQGVPGRCPPTTEVLGQCQELGDK